MNREKVAELRRVVPRISDVDLRLHELRRIEMKLKLEMVEKDELSDALTAKVFEFEQDLEAGLSQIEAVERLNAQGIAVKTVPGRANKFLFAKMDCLNLWVEKFVKPPRSFMMKMDINSSNRKLCTKLPWWIHQ